MKNIVYLSSIIILLLVTFSCKRKSLNEIVRPVKVIKVGSMSELEKIFPGIAEAEEYAYLTFRTGGMLQDLKVEEGQDVKSGQLIAQLDPRDYQLKISAAKATFEQSRSQLDRYKRLYAKEAVSKQDYEIALSKFENDKSVYNQTMNNLKDTRLVAPFTGNIEKKYVENHQEIQAGERIVKLNNPEKIQYRVVLPETNMKFYPDNLKCSIELDINRGVFYNAKVKEIVSSSVDGSGIPVLLAIDDKSFDKKKIKVLPGFTCNVKVEYNAGKSNIIEIPLSSIYSNPKTGQKSVWKINPETSTVHLAPVQTGELTGGSNILILSGLEKGEMIVIAGINMLSEGKSVKILNP